MSQKIPAENERTRQDGCFFIGRRERFFDRLQFRSVDPRSSPEDLYLWMDLFRILICRNIALLIDDDCIRRQKAELAGDYISPVVMEPWNPAEREHVVAVASPSINHITAILQPFREVTPERCRASSENRLHGVDLSRIQERFRTVMEPFGLWDTDAIDELGDIFLQERLKSTNADVKHHTALFSHWRATHFRGTRSNDALLHRSPCPRYERAVLFFPRASINA